MTTICPKCDARFRDPPADVPIERPLQCGACEHEWVRPPVVAAQDRISVDAPPLEPTMRNLIDDDENAIRTSMPVIVPGEEELSDEVFEPLYVDAEPETAHRKQSNWLLPLTGIAAVALLASAVFLKDEVIEQVPQAHSAYAAAGLISPAPELKIADIETSKSTREGIRQLIIRGEIQNVADNSVPVPPLKLTMRGERNVRLYAWTVSAAKDHLKAGERSRFTAVAHDYPGDAVDVEVEFMPSKGK